MPQRGTREPWKARFKNYLICAVIAYGREQAIEALDEAIQFCCVEDVGTCCCERNIRALIERERGNQ